LLYSISSGVAGRIFFLIPVTLIKSRNNISFTGRFLIVILLSTIATFPAIAQQDFPPAEKQADIETILELLMKNHRINIFFKKEWFENRRFPLMLAELEPKEALKEILVQNEHTALYFDHLIVILPAETTQQKPVSIKDHITIIGDPAEYGKYSTVRITGKVLDGSSREPLAGAVVYDDETKTGVSTNHNGEYSLELPAGERRLKISFIGFEEQVVLLRAYGAGNLDFEIFEETHRIDEVTIRAKRAEENVARAQMSMIILDAKTIRELPGSFGERDILRSISLMPGIQTTGEFGTGFHVRGGGSDQNLILIENVPIFNSSHLFGLTSIVNPDIINSATLYKGGVPARFGERASAVLDIRLRNSIPEKSNVSGGIGLINSRLSLETPLPGNKASLSLGGRTSYSDWLLGTIPDNDLMNSSAEFYDVGGTFNFSPSPRNSFVIFGYNSVDGFRMAGTTDYRYSNSLGSVRWNSVQSDKLDFNLGMGFSRYQYSIAEPEEINPLEAHVLNSSIDYHNFKWHFNYYPNESHTVDFGVNATRYAINSGKIKPLGVESFINYFATDPEKAVELAAYISDRFTLGSRIEAEAGFRYTRFYLLGPSRQFLYMPGKPLARENITDTVFYANNSLVTGYGGLEPRFSLRFSINSSSSAKLSYNRINQYINLLSNTSVMSPSDTWKLSDRFLQPLSAGQYAAGYFKNFMDNTLESSIEVYFKKIDNIIEYKNGATILLNETLETDLINAAGYSYGFEFYLNKISGRFTGWISYTWSNTRIRTNEDAFINMINNNNYFPSNHDRPHNLVINTNYHISRRWRFNTTFSFNSGRPVTLPEISYQFAGEQLVHYSERNKYRMPDYHRLDIALHFGENLRKDRRGKGSWSLSVINLYGRKNAYSIYYRKEIPSEENDFRNYGLNKLYIIGRPLPTLTYNFSF
jgi:hypothetical protein